MNIVRSALGHYEPVGNPETADCVVGHSFGTEIGRGSVNRSLAEFILAHNEDGPIIADRMLADAFPKGLRQVDEVVEGPISDTVGRGVGSWGTLVHAKSFMEQLGLKEPLMVAQACHIGRVVKQSSRLGMAPIVPAGLPAGFDKDSEQIWTRSRALWLPREVFGSLVLKAQHKL